VSEPSRLPKLGRDARLLFATRSLRMFSYGLVSVVLVLYLAALGLRDASIGLLLGLTLAGDAAISLWLTTHADRVGRRKVLLIGAVLMCVAGVAFAVTDVYVVLLAAAVIGVISPSGNEVGPFLAVEQASLAQSTDDRERTHVLAWWNLVASFSTAAGALTGGVVAAALIGLGLTSVAAYRDVVVGYAILGLLLALLITRVSPAVEVPGAPDVSVARRLGLHRSQRTVAKLSALFALDAFGGGFVVQALIAYWFNVRYAVSPAVIGTILFAANLLAGISALLAVRIAARIGLIRTMVYTHLPSNVLLILVPFMPTVELATLVLLVRFSISQMDVPTRQSYTMAVVEPDERSAAAGVTGIARSIGAAAAPIVSTPLMGVPGLAALPFVIAGSLKIAYDLLLYRSFQAMRPPEERGDA